MDPQSAEISPVTFVRRESAAISVAMESSLAADAATLTSDNGSERRAFSIGEVQKMTCPRCLHTFPVEFYCIKCGYVPTFGGKMFTWLVDTNGDWVFTIVKTQELEFAVSAGQ